MTVFGSQLARHSKVLQQSLKPGSGSPFDPDNEKDDALHYYANHTAQIEVCLASFQRPVVSFSAHLEGNASPPALRFVPVCFPDRTS